MKRIIPIFSAVCVILGSIIGAGFATGKELFIFFYPSSPAIVALVCGVFFWLSLLLLCFYIRFCSSVSIGGLFKKLFGKLSVVPEYLVLICYFLVLATMVSASNLCLSDLFGTNEKIPIFSTLTAVLCGYALMKDFTGVKIINAVAVPLILVFILVTCCDKGNVYSGENVDVGKTFAYVCFNVTMMIGVLINVTRQLGAKQTIIATAISALLIALLVMLVTSRINDQIFSYVPMPLISIAKQKGKLFYYFASLTLYLSIVTTLISNAFPLIEKVKNFTKDRFFAVTGVMFGATLFSLIGFDKIVALVYPIISILGVILFVFIAFSYLSQFIKRKVSEKRENTKLKLKKTVD